MILSDKDIMNMIHQHKIGIDPYYQKQVQPASYDVVLGDHLTILNTGKMKPIDLRKPSTFEKGLYNQMRFEEYVLKPGEFVLGTTEEHIRLPANIAAMLSGRSTIGRLGLEIHQTAGWIDPGFEGRLTLEIVNNNRHPVVVYKGMRIGQLVFYRVQGVGTPYGMKKGAKYQDQYIAQPPKREVV